MAQRTRLLGLLALAGLVASPGGALAQRADTLPPALISDGQHLLRSSARVLSAPSRWTRDDWVGAAAAGAFIGAASLVDGRLRTFMNEQQSPRHDDAARRIENLGTITNYRVLTALYVAGLIADDEKLRRTATEAVVSSVFAGALITPVLQTATGRQRPRAGHDPYTFEAFGGGHSFPSGHTTQAFAVASVIALEYPRTWVKLVSYGTAAAVGATRMYNGAHFLSDVVAGALLGHAVARAATAQRTQRAQRERGGRSD